MDRQLFAAIALAVACIPITDSVSAADEDADVSVFDQQNLVAWCIVPFDAQQRGPAERAEMLKRLGLERVAYDWRSQHVPTFEQEILEYKKHGLEYFAFWGWHERMAELIGEHDIRPQIWQTLGGGTGQTQAQKIESAARAMLPLVEKTRKIGCRLGLYNHGGWGGEPENMVAVVQWLQEHGDADHVGIVYNLHHGHGHIADFAKVLELMKPHLLCLNLNGMNDHAKPKILPVGAGQHDRAILEIIAKSGYSGPIGILDHRMELDAEESLSQNLEGLRELVAELDAP